MLTGEQIRAARALLRWEQKDLAEAAKLSIETIKRLEKIRGPIGGLARTTDALQAALEQAGITLFGDGRYEGEGGPGVRLTQPIK
ncbi:helix-turn-helix domain-containing protein [Paramagnetospirillum magnetotacticum]|uniref:helix-turn-helix domain-containing protein n=1 Tax=Paramagnetospirillum magnetotacticum TaxID=188 RepID=UPI0005970555|nr:helix-turn-helix transcriptional regulator [Paramagnetospirillum magnetotacticum]